MNKNFLVLLLFIACKNENRNIESAKTERQDPHSFAQSQLAVTTHLDLDIVCDFDHKMIKGTASYDITNNNAKEIILDNIGLHIIETKVVNEKNEAEKANFIIDKEDPILGSAIHIPIHKNSRRIIVNYETTSKATALQWLDAQQTNTKKYPFLLTQSQSIYARSWIPCQDGPGIRFSYHAKVIVPKGMMAAMSAQNQQSKSETGVYEFNMEIPIPAYLMALAVGDFGFKPIGNRTGVYADSTILDKAIWEFADLEKMVETAEQLYGKYPWSRYDVIVLPTSFPFGGMENPRLTFLTPTVIASDRSLTSLLAHELAHSWSGNLVTNATWEDFWLNEGFTTYFEGRIMESLYGKSYADMLSLLGYSDLEKTIAELGDTNVLTKLKLDLKDKNPEDALTDIAYEKGKNLLRYLEERLGRNNWDTFLKSYFDHFKFKSNTTEGFLNYLHSSFPQMEKGVSDTVQAWVYNTGLIRYHPNYENTRFVEVESQLNKFIMNPKKYRMNTANWSTHEWIHFFRKLPKDSSELIRSMLEKQYKFSGSGNAEISFCWINYLIDNGIKDCEMKQVEIFLTQVGRRKFVLPIYEQLFKKGREKEAKALFEQLRARYHPITNLSIEGALYPKI